MTKLALQTGLESRYILHLSHYPNPIYEYVLKLTNQNAISTHESLLKEIVI